MITRTHIISAGLITALLTVLASGIMPARAIEGESIVLSPASVRTPIDAGQTLSKSLKVINDGTTTYDFVVYASPYSVANGDYTPNYTETKPNTDLYTWVDFEKTRYTLNPGENVDVPYTIAVPADAAPGGHYSVIFAETEVSEEDSGQIARKKRVGTIVYATVNGDYILSGEQIDARIDWLQLGGPITASLTVENDGNSDFIMTDKIQVKNVLGGTVYENSGERVVLPKTTRDVAMTWTNGPIMGLYNVSIESKVLDNVSTKQSWVLLMPMWILVVMVLAIVGLIYWAFRRRR